MRHPARLVPVLFGVALAASACSPQAAGDPPPSTSPAPSDQFAPDSSVAALAAAGTIRIGIKTDQPGLSYREPGSSAAPEGFDVEIAKLLADGMGIEPSSITWVEVGSHSRENSIIDGAVDLVVSSYSMTDERASKVGQAGPYYITGQQLMVDSDDSDIGSLEDVEGRTTCVVPGSTSGELLVAEHGAVSKVYVSYAACVDALMNDQLDVMSTDGAILLGFLDQHPDELKIVGVPFTTERYAVGHRHGDTAMCEYVNATLLAAYDDGRWADAFESTLGASGIEAPKAPRPDDCPTAGG